MNLVLHLKCHNDRKHCLNLLFIGGSGGDHNWPDKADVIKNVYFWSHSHESMYAAKMDD